MGTAELLTIDAPAFSLADMLTVMVGQGFAVHTTECRMCESTAVAYERDGVTTRHCPYCDHKEHIL